MSKRWQALGILATISGLVLPQNISAYFTADTMGSVSGYSGDWQPSQTQVAIVTSSQEYQVMGADVTPPSHYSERQLWRLQVPLKGIFLPGIDEPSLLFWCGDKLIWATNIAGDVADVTSTFLLPLGNCQTNENLRAELTASNENPVDVIPTAQTAQVIWLAPTDHLKFVSSEKSAVLHATQSCDQLMSWWQLDQLVLFPDELTAECLLEYWSVDQAGNQSETQQLWVTLPPADLPETPRLQNISVQDQNTYLRLAEPASDEFVSWLIAGETKLNQELQILNWQALSLQKSWPNQVPVNLSGDVILQLDRTAELSVLEIRRLDLYGRTSIPFRYQLE